MSTYCSWPSVGEDDDFDPDGRVLSYLGSHVYPDPVNHLPATVDLALIPSHIGPDGDREPEEFGPDALVAPYLRLGVCEWQGKGLVDSGTVVLTVAGAEALLEQLTEWLGRPKHDR